MAKTATVSWTWPTQRSEGGNLPLDEIAGMEVSLSVAPEAPFTVFPDLVPPVVGEPTASFAQTELGTGDYIYRLVCVDIIGQRSAPVLDTPFNVPDESAPNPPDTVTVTLT